MRLSSVAKSAPLALALTLPLVAVAAPPSYAAAKRGHGSAYGLTADGLVTLPATPAVVSADQQPVRKSVSDLPANPLVEASALAASAHGRQGRASVTDLRMAKTLLEAEVVTAKCEARKGTAYLGKALLNGKRLAANPKPNSALTVPIEGVGDASVVLNSQRRNPQGELTVTAIEVNLPPVAGKPQRVGIASATCGPQGAVAKPAKPAKPAEPGKKPQEPAKKPQKPAQKPQTPAAPEGRPDNGANLPGTGSEPHKPKMVAPAPAPVVRDLPVTG